MKNLIYVFAIWMSLQVTVAQQTSKGKDVDAVKLVLSQQQQAWNQGNIDAFMQGYWKSDSLKFIGKKGITKGWQQTYDNYKKGYPDQASMGQLLFDIIEVEQLSNTAVYVIGKWTLVHDESKGNVGGHFTLMFRKINKQWVIVSDHTS
jgi:ketosteroid isomerase-like protein